MRNLLLTICRISNVGNVTQLLIMVLRVGSSNQANTHFTRKLDILYVP